MAGRPRNRLELRRQHEAAEPVDPVEDETEDAPADEGDDEEKGRRPAKKKKAPAKPKSKAKAKTAKPAARMRIVWAVVNDAFKQVGAPFGYAEKEAALARAAELTARGKGTHFLQKVKEAMPEDAPGLGAAIPRHEASPITTAIAPSDDDEEIEADEEVEEEEDEVEEDDDDE